MTKVGMPALLIVLGGMFGETCAQVVVTDHGVTEKEIKGEQYSYVQKRRSLSVKSTGPVNYGFTYNYTDDPAFRKNAPKHPFPSIGDSSVGTFGLGLTGGGWYENGFLGARVNNKSLHTIVADKIEVVKHQERGIVDFTWRAKSTGIRARFVFLPGDDKVFTELTFTPSEKLDSLSLTMICVPGHWGREKPKERWLSTAVRSVPSTEKTASFELEEETWILHFDANHNRLGSCAVMYLPEQIAKAEAHIGDPTTRTVLTLPPDPRRG